MPKHNRLAVNREPLGLDQLGHSPDRRQWHCPVIGAGRGIGAQRADGYIVTRITVGEVGMRIAEARQADLRSGVRWSG
jgi:hypothetical protein